MQNLLCILKCIREVDSIISEYSPIHFDVTSNLMQNWKRLKLPRLKLTPQKLLKGQLVYTEKHIFIFNLFNETFTSNENRKNWNYIKS